MKSFFILLFSIMAVSALLVACCPDDGTGRKKADYDIIKVCSLGDTDGSSCVQYAAKRWRT